MLKFVYYVGFYLLFQFFKYTYCVCCWWQGDMGPVGIMGLTGPQGLKVNNVCVYFVNVFGFRIGETWKED